MSSIHRSALVPYSAQAMYDLVNDIGSYPQFMQGCIGADVLSRSQHEVLARLHLGNAGFKTAFTTRNRLDPPVSVIMTLEEGPFTHFEASWEITPLAENACKVGLNMDFEFSGGLVDLVLEKLFNASANSLVDALCQRADKLYGK